MAAKDLDAFLPFVLGDDVLMTELIRYTDRRSFISRVMEIGLENGFDFSEEDVEQSIVSNRKRWTEL